VYFVSLGCPKNRVDSEIILGGALERGHQIVTDPALAEVIVVNTCGFIGEAKEESIDTILELAQHKTSGRCKKLVVTGCLTQRYPREIADQIPEIDQIFGSGEVAKVAGAFNLEPVAEADKIDVAPEPSYLADAGTTRTLGGPAHTAYVKIAEGCDRPCAFCIIPKLRGPQRSRSVDDVVAEATALVARGARELNLVAQDLTKYGDDLPAAERPDLAELLRRVARVPGVHWVRLHYAYPSAVTDELIEVIATEPRVAKYLDVPFQHADDLVLKRMRRGHGKKLLEELVDKLRARIPGLVLRTTFLVGHPGESEAAFNSLCEFVERARPERMGVFTFSREDGTVAAILPDRVPAALAKKRRTQLMRLGRSIAKTQQQAMIGREIEVLVDGPSAESEYVLAGRWYGQAPEIDGTVYLSDGGELERAARAGDLVRCLVTGTADHDLAATMLEITRAGTLGALHLPLARLA
jgi:ribosomal protein S12 methylthiotransferase